MSRTGFTLIELLIVVVIIGILAAIAIPKFASTKEKAYLASMKSDLRNGATAQEGYFADNQVVPERQGQQPRRRRHAARRDGQLYSVGGRDHDLHRDGGHRLERGVHPQRDPEDLRHLHRRGGGCAGHGRRRAEVYVRKS